MNPAADTRATRDRAPRVLTCSAHPATVRAVTQVVCALGGEVEVLEVLDASLVSHGRATHHVGDPAPHSPVDLVVVDVDLAPPDATASLAARATTPWPTADLMIVAGPDARRRLLGALTVPSVVHLVPKQPLGSDPAGFCGPDERELFVALSRRGRRHAAGVAPYLAPMAEARAATIESSDEMTALVEEVDALARRVGLRDERLRRVQTIIEELIENALYDAPVDAEGRHPIARQPRTQPVHLGPHQHVRIAWGTDGRSFAISVADGFGSLDRATLVDHLLQLAAPDGLRTTDGPGGAGIGLALSAAAANHIAFTVVPGRLTEVVAVVDIGGSNRASLARGTAVHLYLHPGAPGHPGPPAASAGASPWTP